MSECNVCVSEYDNFNNKEVKCNKCGYSACRECCKSYILSFKVNPHCMNCKTEWNRDFFVLNFEKKFINNELKKHKEDILFEIEKALLPETQIDVENEKKNILLRDKISILRETLKELKDEVIDPDIPTLQRLKLSKEHDIKEYKINREIQYLQQCIAFIKDNKIEEKERRVSFIKPCPSNDCKGYLSTNWTCGMCKIKVCKDCLVIKSGNHECLKDDLETARLLRSNSKPCPKCGAMISKIDGCDQMFHTPLSGGCGAVFDWITLKIQDGKNIHNPHWFEYLRKTNGSIPRNPNDGCMEIDDDNDDINWNHIFGLIRVIFQHDWDSYGIYSEIVQNIATSYNHNRFVIANRYNIVEFDNKDLRVKYLLEEIDEDKFKRQLQQRHKSREKKADLGQIVQVYISATKDIFRRFYEIRNVNKCKELINEFLRLVEYINNSLKEACQKFDCKLIYITENFVVSR